MPAHPLRVLIYRRHLAIDRAFVPLADAAEAAILRHAAIGADGVPRLTALGAALALGDVERAMAGGRTARAGVVVATQADAGRLGEDG